MGSGSSVLGSILKATGNTKMGWNVDLRLKLCADTYFEIMLIKTLKNHFGLLSAYICCSTYMRQFVFVLLVVCLQFLPFVWALFVCFPFIFLHSVCQSFCVAFSAHYESYCCTFCIKILIWFSFLFYCAISN